MATKKKSAKTVTIRKKGKKPISFHEGGLHESTGTPMGQKIPASKVQRALAGGYGPKAKKQAQLMRGPLAQGQKTAARRRRSR